MSGTGFDALIRGGRIWTDGAVRPDADAIAIRGGRIAAIGRFESLAGDAAPGAEVWEAAGGTVTPGLTDAHLHLLHWARSLDEVSLHDCASAAEAARRVGDAARAAPGRPLVGRGWDANAWPDAPHRRALDDQAPAVPVLLHSKDFHALWVNGAALDAAGVTRSTRDPDGGRFERDAAGELTGVVREHAVRAFAALESAARGADPAPALVRAIAALHARGVTAVHDFEAADARAALEPLARRRDGIRVLAHLAHAELDDALARGLASGAGDDRFRIGAVKLFADGTLGSRTAALLEPYDGTAERGMDLLPRDALARDAARALAGGIAVAVHAIGDRAARHVLDAFAAAGAALARPALPSRIEHLQLVHPDDAPRLAPLGVAASMQPSHCVSDIPLAERWWGSRRDHAYPWRTLLGLGARLAFGSDAPVEPPDPGEGLAAACTRRDAAGRPEGGWVPEQCLSLDEALTAYTEGPARLAGAWPRIGTLRPGARADLVVWNADLHALAGGRLRSARPRLTMLDGVAVHRSD